MNDHNIPKPLRAGAALALVAILLGFGLGGVFGAAEEAVKKRLDDSGTAALETAYKGDVAAKDAVVKKSFDYLVRAHLHGGAIGAAALASAGALALFSRMDLVAQFSALSFGAGAVLYSLFWLLAGFMAPGLGGTGAAKEALRFVAVPGAGLALLGATGTLFSIVKDALTRRH